MRYKVAVLLMAILLATGASAATETVLWNFDTANGGAGNPQANNLISDGTNFYGATWEGGNTAGCLNGCGTVFELSPNSGGGWNETLLYAFDPANGTDGNDPLGGLVRDKQGNFYGATYFGGGSTACDNGCGTVFELTHGSSGWMETVLYRFTGGSDGNYPHCTLAMGKDGSLYGTTYGDGGTKNLGTVFRLSPGGQGWKLTTLHHFDGKPDGEYPEGGVTLDKAGHLYGTTSEGGVYNSGTVYELARESRSWKFQVLHSFNGTDGASPAWAGVVIDQAHNLYGTTQMGGLDDTGTVWELAHSDGKKDYSEKVLYSFGPKGGGDGNYPWAGVTIGGDGTLYGTTSQGGADNWGIVFSLTKNKAKKWNENILYSFTGGKDGAQPGGALFNGGSGHLYGVADGGGANFVGAVFEIVP